MRGSTINLPVQLALWHWFCIDKQTIYSEFGNFYFNRLIKSWSYSGVYYCFVGVSIFACSFSSATCTWLAACCILLPFLHNLLVWFFCSCTNSYSLCKAGYEETTAELQENWFGSLRVYREPTNKCTFIYIFLYRTIKLYFALFENIWNLHKFNREII